MPLNILHLAFLVLFCTISLYKRGLDKRRQLPANGFGGGVATSYLRSIYAFWNAKIVVHALQAQFENKLFTLPLAGEWCVMVSRKDHVKDLCTAPEELLSMESSADDILQFRHTIGDAFVDETYHIPVIRSMLNLNLSAKLPELLDELTQACAEDFEPRISDSTSCWTPLNPNTVIPRIICRASNRVFIGEPLCRNEDYIRLLTSFNRQALVGGALIKMLVPRMLRRSTGALFRFVHGHHRRNYKHLKPLIQERKKQIALSNQCPPADMLTWLIQSSPEGQEHSDESIAMRMLNVNSVALHTTTKACIQVLYTLASKPEYIPILRSEMHTHLDIDNPLGWTKEAFVRCVKLDSFLKEVLRLHNLGAIWLPRLTMSDFAFSDGTTIPAGNLIAVAATTIHEDPSIYHDPLRFDGFRFCREREDSGGSGGWQHRLTGTSASYLTFGGGRHLCPGRFFAALEMKSLMAYILFHYDMKMEKEGFHPGDEWFGPSTEPSRTSDILFRRLEGRRIDV